MAPDGQTTETGRQGERRTYAARQGGQDCGHGHRTGDAALRCGRRMGWDAYGSPRLWVMVRETGDEAGHPGVPVEVA